MQPLSVPEVFNTLVVSFQTNQSLIVTLLWPLLLTVATFVIFRGFLKHMRYAHAGILEMDHLSPFDFEEFFTKFFKRLNYKIEHVGNPDAYGLTMIVNQYGSRTAVHIIRNIKHVNEELLKKAAETKDKEHCGETLVITNHTFTRQARKFAQTHNITLWPRDTLTHQLHLSQKQEKQTR